MIYLALIITTVALLWAIFNPRLDFVPLYHGESWYILWYNRYHKDEYGFTVYRDWFKLFTV